VPKDNTTGQPTRATCDGINNNNWSMFYLTYATATAIGNMYDNVNGLRDSFVAYWKTVATAFASNPFVIGYELMNEPVRHL
jgi:endoglycosylceramidase